MLLTVCALLALAVIALWQSASWWIPRWLPVVAQKYGVQVEALTIDPSGTWHLESLQYADESWRLRFGSIRMDRPLRWVWTSWRGHSRKHAVLSIDSLLVEQLARSDTVPAGEQRDFDLSPSGIWRELEDSYALIAPWLPEMHLQAWQFVGLDPLPTLRGNDWVYVSGSVTGKLNLDEWAPSMEARLALERLPEATWHLTARMHGDYVEWDQPLEAVEFNASAYLRETGFYLREFSGKAPWFEARLSRPVQFDFTGPSIRQDARIELSLDLSGQVMLPISGQFEGWLDLAAGDLDWTGQGWLGFGGEIRDLVYTDFPELTTRRIKGSGSWDGRRVELSSLGVQASHAEWGELDWTGEGFWRMDTMAGRVEGELNLNNEFGRLRSQLWIAFADAAIEGRLLSATVTPEDFMTIELAEAFSWRLPKAESGNWDWRLLELDPLVLITLDAEAHVRIDWQPQSDLNVVVQQLPLALLSPWMEIPDALRDIQVEVLKLRDFNWQEGLRGGAELVFSSETLEWQDQRILTRAELAAEFKKEGLQVEHLRWLADGEVLAEGQFHLPLHFRIPSKSDSAFVHLSDSPLWEGGLSVDIPDAIADWLSTTGVVLGESRIDFTVEGEGEAVAVRLEAAMDKLRLPAREGIEDAALIAERLRLSVHADRDAITIERALIDWGRGHLSALAQLPLSALQPDDGISINDHLRSGDWLDQLTADLDLERFQVAFWQDFLPPIVRPDGRLEGRLSIRPGRNFSGELIASDFALRPTLTAQGVESIQARLLLQGTRIEIRDAGARVGGSAAKLEGSIDFSDREQLEWMLRLSGQNLPLVRTVDMLLRADVDLRLMQNRESDFVPLIEGRVDLRSSSLWVQFDPLAPRPAGRRRGPEPPFFEVEQDFLQNWRLDISISGNRFLRVRNPWFAAEMGATFLLSGTLGQPLLTGALILESGVVRMPAMNMRFDRGEIFISPEEANEIRLDLSATGQRANHVITVDARGTVSNPQLQFRAIPDLTQAQILRILTTGGLENAGAGSLGFYLGRGLLGPGGMEDGLADRLQFDYGRAISNTGRNTVDVEWRLTDRTAIRGQYDEFDAYNLDFLWRVLRR